MTSNEIRKAFLEFFISKGHKEIPVSPLVLEDDPSTLFTSSGMQQLVPYLKGKPHPLGKRLADSQPSLRMQDIEEVGDNRHTTFFEMLGNWSLGDYFKEEQLPWCWEFYTKEIGFDPKDLHVTVFEGDGSVSKDTESLAIWKRLGVGQKRIHFYGVEKNWWSRAGTPAEMPEGEIGGPDSEIFFEFENVEHRSEFGPLCHPNCECGRFVEIGNSVFIQYKKEKDGSLSELSQKNVDFGGGLERIAVALRKEPDIFQIDLIAPLVKKIEQETGAVYGQNEKKDRSVRIIADHVRSAMNLLAEGIRPANKLHGYALRRLVRRSMFHLHLLGAGVGGSGLAHIGEELKDLYPQISKNWEFIDTELQEEGKRFADALRRGLGKLRKAVEGEQTVSGKFVFDLYQTEGFPMELTLEVLGENGINFSAEEKKSFQEEFEKHKDLSKATSSFKH